MVSKSKKKYIFFCYERRRVNFGAVKIFRIGRARMPARGGVVPSKNLGHFLFCASLEGEYMCISSVEWNGYVIRPICCLLFMQLGTHESECNNTNVTTLLPSLFHSQPQKKTLINEKSFLESLVICRWRWIQSITGFFFWREPTSAAVFLKSMIRWIFQWPLHEPQRRDSISFKTKSMLRFTR